MNRTYRKVYYTNTFRMQCYDVDPLTMVQFDRAVENVKKIVKNTEIQQVTKIIATGCGDSNLVGPAVKEAFDYYLPEIDFRGMQALELSRYYDYSTMTETTAVIAASVSGKIPRTNECLKRANKHRAQTIAMTDSLESECANSGKYLYHTNTPKGDNNAGLRTYFANCLCLIVFAASLAEEKHQRNYLLELRQALLEYHDEFFKELEKIDDLMFNIARLWINKKTFEVVADGPLYHSGKFIAAKFAEVPGDVCSVIDSEDYMHVNSLMYPDADIGEMIMINSNDSNLERIVHTVNQISKSGRGVLVFSDKNPSELGIEENVEYCHVVVPPKKFNFLAPLYLYLPASILAGYRATTTGEPMFRGGFDSEIFEHSYFSPEEILD